MDASEAMETPLCGANTRQGRTCRRTAGWGTGHVGLGKCKNHGGSTPNHELKAAVELARRDTAMHARPLDIDPHHAIIECVRLAAGWVQYAFDRLNDLGAGDLVGPTISTRPLKQEKGAEHRTERVEEHGPPAAHIWLKVHGEYLDRLVHYSKTAIACGIAERQIELAEGQARLIANFAAALMRDLGVDPASEKARHLVGKHLRLIAGGQAA